MQVCTLDGFDQRLDVLALSQGHGEQAFFEVLGLQH